jgi:hypothetical protein
MRLAAANRRDIRSEAQNIARTHIADIGAATRLPFDRSSVAHFALQVKSFG